VLQLQQLQQRQLLADQQRLHQLRQVLLVVLHLQLQQPLPVQPLPQLPPQLPRQLPVQLLLVLQQHQHQQQHLLHPQEANTTVLEQ
jgi:hypothetical protein